MIKLIDMKHPKASKEKAMTAEIERDRYPYGLRIRLENDDLEKLGLEKLPESGARFTVMGDATVIGTNESADEGREKRRSLELQIRKLGLEPQKGKKPAPKSDSKAGEKKSSMSEQLYGKDK